MNDCQPFNFIVGGRICAKHRLEEGKAATTTSDDITAPEDEVPDAIIDDSEPYIPDEPSTSPTLA